MVRAVSFHITNRCNNRCRHCLFKSGEEKIDEMDTKHIEKFISEFAAVSGNKGKLNIYGGEPLIRSDIFDVIDIAHSHNLEVEIATSGVVSEKVINRFLNSGVEYICCDLDGGIAESHDWLRNRPGHFEMMKGLIKKFVNTGAHTSVTMVVNNQNKGEIVEFFKTCQELKVSNATINIFSPSGRGTLIKDLVVGPEDWLELHEVAQDWYLNNKPNFTVRWQISYKEKSDINDTKIWDCEPEADGKFFLRCDGNIYSCPLLSGSQNCLGNVKEESLEAILKKRASCAISGRKGCPGMTYHVFGNPNLEDPRIKSTDILPTCPREIEVWKPDGNSEKE